MKTLKKQEELNANPLDVPFVNTGISAKPLKVGVIGTGGIVDAHMPGWEMSPYTEVVGGCDVSEAALDRWSSRWGISRIERQAELLINDPDIDIIDICTPNNYHAPLAIAALEAGKHVLCEKPLSPKPDDIQRMIDARDRSGKLLMTAQHFRFTGTAKAMKAELDKGVLGEVYHARSWMLRRGIVPTTPGFMVKQNSSGGACIDIGVHILDLTLWFMGNPKPVSVTGVARSELSRRPGAFTIWSKGGLIPQDIMDVEEFASAFIRFENGATLILEVSWMLHHDTPDEDMQMWLYGNEGGGHWPHCSFYKTDNNSQQFINSSLMRKNDLAEPHAQECIEFAQAVMDGAPSPVPAEQSLQVMQILDAVYKSQETGREVILD